MITYVYMYIYTHIFLHTFIFLQICSMSIICFGHIHNILTTYVHEHCGISTRCYSWQKIMENHYSSFRGAFSLRNLTTLSWRLSRSFRARGFYFRGRKLLSFMEVFDAAHLDSSNAKHTAGIPTVYEAITNKPHKLLEGGTAKEDITSSQWPLQLLRFPLHPLSNSKPVDSLPAMVRDAQRPLGSVSVVNVAFLIWSERFAISVLDVVDISSYSRS